jgi:penicillin amidase
VTIRFPSIGWVAVALSAAVVAACLLAGGAAADPLSALVVLPPGEGNTITPDAFAKYRASGDCSDLGPHVCDQLDAYEHWRFRPAPLSPDADHVAGATSRESPAPGVTIVRDAAGVPHVFASGPNEQAIEERIGYGVGYAQAEERLFQMEVLRRAAEGRLSDLLGPDYLTMDVVTRRDSETDGERHAQVAALPPGQQRSLQSYADGINAVIQRDSGDPSKLPAGFTLTQDLPIAPWTPEDTVAVLTLEVKGVAESAGNELGYAGLVRRLAARYGMRRAVRIFDDLQLTRDPRAPTSVPHGQKAGRTSDGFRYRYLRYSARDTAARAASLPASVDAADRAMVSGDRALAAATHRLGLPVFGSNAWAIAPRRSTTGGAQLWGGPQVSYYAPPVFDELELQGGLAHLHGVGVPGGGPGAAIGYTPHTAWTITTAQDDQVDTYVDRIRSDGRGGFEYRWRDAWHAVEQRTETIRSRDKTPDLPLVGTLAPPSYTDHTVTLYRTLHGPRSAPLPCVVVYLDPQAGVSYCKVRAFWGRELQTGRALVGVNQASNLAGFDAAVRSGVAGFNFVYADDSGHIGYWHTGVVPVRARGHDPRLPAPGDGSFDWRGYLDPRHWPSVVDPRQGWVASWNNKPQRSWLDSGDGSLWGHYQRVRQPMSLLRPRRRFTPTGTWRVARRTGELDLRATLGFKPFLTRLARARHLTALERAAIRQVAGWDGTAFYPDGAERSSTGAETGRVAAPGFAILSAWFHALESRVAAPVFRPVVPGPDFAKGVRSFTQTPQTTSPEFEFFDDYDAFLYKVMTGAHGYRRYLGRASVSGISRAALDQAVAGLSSSQGPDPARWRAPMPQIVFQSLDVADLPSVPWENRGTWGQAIALGRPSHAPARRR